MSYLLLSYVKPTSQKIPGDPGRVGATSGFRYYRDPSSQDLFALGKTKDQTFVWSRMFRVWLRILEEDIAQTIDFWNIEAISHAHVFSQECCGPQDQYVVRQFQKVSHPDQYWLALSDGTNCWWEHGKRSPSCFEVEEVGKMKTLVVEVKVGHGQRYKPKTSCVTTVQPKLDTTLPLIKVRAMWENAIEEHIGPDPITIDRLFAANKLFKRSPVCQCSDGILELLLEPHQFVMFVDGKIVRTYRPCKQTVWRYEIG